MIQSSIEFSQGAVPVTIDGAVRGDGLFSDVEPLWSPPQWSLTRAVYFNLVSTVLCWTVVAIAAT